MRRTSAPAILTAAFVVAVLGGCGSPAAPASSPSQPSAEQPKPAVTPSEPPSDSSEPAEPAPETVNVEITIEEGDVDPAGEQVELTVGQTVVLVVNSDAADELHVHSAPDDHEFAIEPGQNQSFRFPVEQPGQFDVETHDTGVLVVQLVVRP